MITVCVKHGATGDHSVSLPMSARVSDLKEVLAAATGVFARHQKLIYKGRVLADDGQVLADARVGDGAKLMLLIQQGQAIPGRSGAAAAAAAAARTPAARSAAAAAQQHGGSSSSSLLASKMADMASRQQRASAGSSSSSSSLPGLPERRAMWSKTGIISLRDLQLTAIQPAWLEGLPAARAADFSHNNALAALPDSVQHLASLASLKATHDALQDAGMPWARLPTNLASLHLGHNQLTLLPACVSALTALTALSLQGNALAALEPAAFEGLGRLEALQLQGNRLPELPASLGACCSSLVALDASHNALTALPDSFTRLAKLQVLAVDANKLRALPPRLLSVCSALCTLAAHHNPLTVDDLRAAEGYEEFEARRQARASKQLDGRVMADTDRAFSVGADVEQWQRWVRGPSGLGSDGSGRAGKQ